MQNRHAIRRLEVVYLKGNKGGYGLIYQNIMRNPDIPVYSKLLYAYLSSFADKDGMCYPSKKCMCRELNITEKTASKYMKPLTDRGIVRVERKKEHGLLTNNIYYITHTINDGSCDDGSCDDGSCDDGSCDRCVVKRGINNNIINSNISNNNTLNSNTINNTDKSTLSTICTSTTISTNTCISNIPTVDQVENECSRYGFEIEPVKFVEHCKSRNIKDWKFELYTYSAAAAGRNRNRRKEMKD